MKNIAIALLTLLSTATASDRAPGCGAGIDESPAHSVSWPSFTAYCKEMDRLKKPRVLIVGCGHLRDGGSVDGDHTHEDCWVTNVKTLDARAHTLNEKPDSAGTSGVFWQDVKANAEMDITSPIPLVGYTDQFDRVVLEKLGDPTMSKKWTLWNAAKMLKVGGELVVEFPQHSSAYSYKRDSSLAFAFPEQNSSRIQFGIIPFIESGRISLEDLKPHFSLDGLEGDAADLWFVDLEVLEGKLRAHDCKISGDKKSFRLPLNRQTLSDMGSYLELQGFSEVCPFISGLNWQTLTATKTQVTQDALQKWRQNLLRQRLIR